MNEEALKYSFDLFVKDGYNGTIDDYKELIKTNDKARSVSYNLFTSDGYNGSDADFNNLMGIDNTIMLSDEELGKTNDSANVDPSVESDTTGSGLGDGLLDVLKHPLHRAVELGYDFVDGLQKGEIKEDKKIGTGYALGRAYADGNTEGIVDLVIESVPSFAKTAKNLVYDQLIVDGLDFLSTNIGIAAFVASEGRHPTPEEKLAISTASDYAQVAQGLTISDLRKAGQASDTYLDQYVTRFDNTISEEIAKGSDADFSQIAGRIVRDAVGSAPYTIASLNPYSATLLGTAIAADKFEEEFKKNPDETLGSVLGNAVTTGGIEMIDAFISRKLLRGKGLLKGGNAKMAEKAVKQMNKGISRKVLDILGIAGKEGVTEMGQSIATKINDEAWLGDEDTWATDAGSNIVRDMYSIMDEGIIGAFTGGGMASIATAAQGNKALKNRAEQLLKPEEVQKKEKEIITKIADNNKLKVQAEKEGKKSRAEALDKLIKKDYTDLVMLRNGNKAVLEKLEGKDLQDYAKNIDAIAGLKDGETTTEIENEIKRLQDVNRTLIEKAIGESIGEYESYDALISEAGKKFTDKEFQKYKQGATKLSKDLGFGYKRKPKTYKTTNGYINAVAKNENISFEEAKELVKNSDGVFLGEGVMLIDESVAKMTGAITAASHEILHPVFNAALGDANAQGEIVKEFKKAMTSKQRRFVRNKLKESGIPAEKWNTEYLTYFSDAILKNEINYDKNLFEKLKDVVLRVLKGAGFDNVSFDSGREVYNFLKEYNTSLRETGQVSEKAVEAIKAAEQAKGVKAADVGRVGAVQKSVNQEILDLTDALDAAEDAYAADPNNPTLEKNVELAEKALDEAEERAISGAPKPKVVTLKPKKEVKKEVKKEDKPKAKKETTSKQKELNEKVDKLAGKKDEDGNYVMSKKEWDRTGIGKASQSIIYGDILNPLITRGITGEGVQGKSLQDFIQAVKDELLPVLMNFNPEKNNSLIGWINSQLRFKKGNVLKRFKKEADLGGKSLDVEAGETGFAGNISGDAGVIRNFANEKQIAPENLIKASKVISTKVRAKLASDLKTWAEANGINFDFFNFGDVDPNITIQVDGKDVKILNEVLKELFPGVDPEKFLDSRTMFTSGEAGIVLGKLAENDQELVELFINLLPRGAIMPKGKNKAIVKDANYGKSTRLDGSILKNFYNKGTERFTKKAGLTPFTLKDNIRYSDVHQAFGMDSSGNKLNYQRAKSGIVLASAYKMLGKLILNEVIRTDLGLTAEQQMNVGAGKGDLQFSINATPAERAAINRLPDSLVEILQDFKNKVFSSFTGTKLSNKGGREDVNKEFRRLQEKYAKNKDFLLILEKIDEVKANLQSMGWWEQEENLVKTFIKVSKLIKGITITQRKVNTNANELDYKFKFLGKEFVVEVKKNTKAILGSIGLHATKKNGKYDFKLDDKYKSVFSEKQIQDIVGALKEQRLNYLTTLDEIVRNSDNEYGLTEKDFKIEVLDNNRVRTRISRKLKVLLNINLTTEDKNAFPELKPGALSWVIYSNKPKNKLLVDLTSVDKYYAQKGGNIINFSDVGAFAIGDPVKNEFSGVLPNLSDVKLKDGKSPKVEIASRWKIAGKGDEFTLYQIAQLKLDLVENQRALENNSDYNLQITENLEGVLNSLYNNIQLSQTENAIQTYNKENKADLQLSKSMNSEFNQMIEKKSGIDARGTISKYKASVMGRKKGQFQFFIPPGAEDFEGLMYKLLDKGKLGEQQKEWFKRTLFDPFARGINEFDTYKLQVANSVRQLKKSLKDIPKELGKRDPKTDFKYEDAVRVYLWQLNGHEIKGISESDIKALVDIVKNSTNLKRFARQLNRTMGGYPKPQDSWLAGTITTDAINMVNTLKRAEFLETWQQNADIIFSEDNLNKLEATFGEDYVEALKDSLYRMKSGRNRPSGANKLTNRFMNWVNDSVATIMFFNTRSALLQTLSTVNFINWGDNNPLLAAKAFSNQKQFWGDFAMLFNSDFLKSRRTGLKNDVNADEIANAAATQTNKVKAALAILLKAGFLPTQIADSFAIAMGGASFYRNRVNTYMQKGEGKPGMGRLAAEEQAFLDFQEIAEATQQSSRPDRVSQQQASPLGRIILAFANTPMQYMRLTKKAFLDLKNGRGSAKENITKMLYYAAIQNVIFSSLQAALFATLFDDEEEEETKKKGVRVANTMLDSMLRGLGIYGAVASTVKNIAMEIDKQSTKDRPDYSEAAIKALDLSPPISSKIRKGRSAGRAFSYKKTREKMVGFGLDNPAYYAVGQIASATANIPLDRAIGKANHVRLAFAQETKFWQSLSLLLGFSEWDLNMIEKDKKKSKFGQKMNWKKRKIKKRKLK